ncbi:uncharacterized protein LOC111085353 [Limulus polyphemus]|uniref:Uncharacterized protein LOC111085353 n=1 Tax=Limulus polyphemus TaxID=6850 RepID=A0ABM1S6I4_LIMPO|nr:uncharacterized protein LOC111085353 [Limulus polyphemus]
MTTGCRILLVGMRIMLFLLWTELHATIGHPSRPSYQGNHIPYPSVSSLRASSEDLAYSLPTKPNQFLLGLYTSKLTDPVHTYNIPNETAGFPTSGVNTFFHDAINGLTPEDASQMANYFDVYNENADPEVMTNDLKTYKLEDGKDLQMPLPSILESIAAKRGNRPSISVVSPLDVLSQRLRFEMARHWMRKSQKQIKDNAELLRNLGKRDTAQLDPTFQDLQRLNKDFRGYSAKVRRFTKKLN